MESFNNLSSSASWGASEIQPGLWSLLPPCLEHHADAYIAGRAWRSGGVASCDQQKLRGPESASKGHYGLSPEIEEGLSILPVPHSEPRGTLLAQAGPVLWYCAYAHAYLGV